MPSKCSNTVCPNTSITAAIKNAIGRRTLCFRLPENAFTSAHTSSPKKLTTPTVAVAEATSSAIQNKIHSVWRW